jgi:hypothetical protein
MKYWTMPRSKITAKPVTKQTIALAIVGAMFIILKARQQGSQNNSTNPINPIDAADFISAMS